MSTFKRENLFGSRIGVDDCQSPERLLPPIGDPSTTHDAIAIAHLLSKIID